MLRTFLRGVSLLIALSMLVFGISEWAPGDSVSALRMNPEYSPETLEAVRARLGLRESWGVRYGQWLGSVLEGDLGRSLAYEMPVTALLRSRWEATARLNGVSTLFSWALALPLGCWLASQTRGGVRLLSHSLGAFVLAFPEILLALLGLWWFGGGSALPYAVLAAGAVPVLTVHVSRYTGAALRESAVVASRLHGIGGARLWWSYILPLAAAPLLSLAGLSFGSVLSASLVVESVLEVPGLGSLLLEAIQARDTPVIAAVTGLAGTLLVGANVGADLLRRMLDPRLRRATW